MISSDTPRGRHRLVEDARRPALAPRSATVVAATVGVVLTMGVQGESELPAPRPQPDDPVSALQPVVLEPRAGHADPVPAALTGRSIAGAHATGFAAVRPDHVPAEPVDVPRSLFAA